MVTSQLYGTLAGLAGGGGVDHDAGAQDDCVTDPRRPANAGNAG
jgi:hypothetical protein